MLFVQWNLGLRTLWFTPVSARAQRPVENIAPVHVKTFSFVVNWIFAMKPKQYPRPTATHKPKQTQTKVYVNRCSTVFYLKFGLITLWVGRRQLTITLLIVCGEFHILYSLGEPLSPHPASISIFNYVCTWEHFLNKSRTEKEILKPRASYLHIWPRPKHSMTAIQSTSMWNALTCMTLTYQILCMKNHTEMEKVDCRVLDTKQHLRYVKIMLCEIISIRTCYFVGISTL